MDRRIWEGFADGVIFEGTNHVDPQRKNILEKYGRCEKSAQSSKGQTLQNLMRRVRDFRFYSDDYRRFVRDS